MVLKRMKNILIVCTGNTCRSPMAEVLLKDRLEQLGKAEEYHVISRGVAAFFGQPASDNAIIALNEIGLDLTQHKAQRLEIDDIKNADLIYVMSNGHKEVIVSEVPESASKIKVLDIIDPYGLELEDYQICRDALINIFKKEFPDA